MAFRADWYGQTRRALGTELVGGGRCASPGSCRRRKPAYDYRGTKGNKLNWEMVPMAEFLVDTGQLPGDASQPHRADNTVHIPATASRS